MSKKTPTSFEVDFVPVLPVQGNCPKVTITGDDEEVFTVNFYDNDIGELVFSSQCKNNQSTIGDRQWYTNWFIEILDSSDKVVHRHMFNLTGKVVFIKIDAYALGDNIAWIPYIEEFRKKHNCTVICSTFFNHMFQGVYKNILFIKPNIQIQNVYAQYYIGANEEENEKYSPVCSYYTPLQMVASAILGMEHKEVNPRVSFSKKRSVEGKYICISEFASDAKKEWKHPGGWQTVVDFLNNNGYQVMVISKEPTELKNVINKTGNIPLSTRMSDIYNAEFFMGVSSGLSWLSWAVGTHSIMISECTPIYHEFQSNITRIGGSHTSKVDYDVSHVTDITVILKLLSEFF